MTPQEQQQMQVVQAMIAADPQIQQLVQQNNAGPIRQRYGWVALEQYIKQHRPDIQQALDSLPSQGLGGSTWMVDDNGRVVENSGVTWGSVLRPAAIVGGGVAANAVLPGAGAASAAPAGGVLPSSSIPAAGGISTGAAIPAAGTTVGGTGVSIAGGGGGIGGWLGNNWQRLLGIGGSALGNAAETMAQNRGSKFAGQLNYDVNQMQRDRDYWGQLTDQAKLTSELNIDREVEGREGRGDAWKRLLQAERTVNPVQYDAGPYGPKPRTVSPNERAGADAMTAEVMARLQGGNPIPVPNIPTPSKTNLVADLGELDAGGYERGFGWLSPALSPWYQPRSTTRS